MSLITVEALNCTSTVKECSKNDVKNDSQRQLFYTLSKSLAMVWVIVLVISLLHTIVKITFKL